MIIQEQQPHSDDNKRDDISIKTLFIKVNNLWRYLITKWLTILLFGILGSALGITYAIIKKTVYTATTTFVLEDGKDGGGLGQYSGLASMAGIDLGGGGGIFQGDNIFELYKSRSMIVKTLLTEVYFDNKKLLLVDYFIDFNNLRDDWSTKPELLKLRFDKYSFNNKIPNRIHSRLQDSILGAIASDISEKYLTVDKVDKKLSIIKVEISSKNEFFAKKFNEEIVRNVNDFYVQTKTKKSLVNVAILQSKTDSVRSIMNGDIYTAAAISDATPNLNPTRQAQRSAPIQRSQYSAESNKAMLMELVKNLELSKISLRKEAPLIQVIDQPVYPLNKTKIGKLKGAIVGGMLSGFLIILVLLTRRFLKTI